MQTLIIYASHHGTTETVANQIQSKLGLNHTKLVRISEVKNLDLDNYDIVLLGSSIHAGRNQNSMQRFCKKNMPELLQKRVGLFLCCMSEGKEAVEAMEKAYPELLRNRAFCIQLMGGEYKIEKMNFIERFLLRKIAGATESQSNIKQDGIDKFVLEVKYQM